MSDSTDHVTLRVKRLDGNTDIATPSYETEGASGLDLRLRWTGNSRFTPAISDLFHRMAISLPWAMKPRSDRGADWLSSTGLEWSIPRHH